MCPAAVVDYWFTGLLEEVYDTVFVRLHGIKTLQKDQLWHYTAARIDRGGFVISAASMKSS
jgi:hypothetical protein